MNRQLLTCLDIWRVIMVVLAVSLWLQDSKYDG